MSTQTNPVQVDIWGCRGSRSLPPRSSRYGTHTSCYSIALGEEVIVLDAGRGITKLSNSLRVEPRFKNVKRLHIFVSHSHLDRIVRVQPYSTLEGYFMFLVSLFLNRHSHVHTSCTNRTFL